MGRRFCKNFPAWRGTLSASLLTLPLALFAPSIRAAAAAAPREISFQRDIRPILSDKCFQCHGPDANNRQADLRLDVREAAIEAGVVIPGDPDASEVVRRVSADGDERMPPPEANKTLSAEQKDLLRRWIAAGAEYEPHWAFVPLAKMVVVPKASGPGGWVRTPIDAFVLERLEAEGLRPAPPANPEELLRRVTLDLTGLPPTPKELDEFVADPSPAAYAGAVDRLLASPAFGERMAVDWLDAARYADTFGYQADREMHVWPWRQWVICAFNRNLPYDDFLTWQIAGDLLPNATDEQVLATAFQRLHRQTNEGGSTPEEFRVEYVSDRVHTLGTAVLGLTLECARCHDHKFDPISQRDYYALSAFLANIDEHGLYSHFTETAPTPAMLLYEPGQREQHERLWAQIREAEAERDAIAATAVQRMTVWRASHPDVTPRPPAHRFSLDDVEPSGDNRLIPGVEGQALQFSGDDAFRCDDAGHFNRVTPFSFALWLKPAEHKPRSVVLHYSRAAEDSAFRGYSLVLDDGFPTFSLIHFWPGNAIRVRAAEQLPLGQWTHLTITYDGSSRAAGLRIYINGRPTPCETIRDGLRRDITHRKDWGDADVGNIHLTLGARFRDVGFAGGAIDELFVYDFELTELEVSQLLPGSPLPQQDDAWLAHYLRRHDDAFRAAEQKLHQLREQENEFVAGVRQIMVMRERPGPPFAYVLRRGAYDARGERVDPDVPAALGGLPEGAPRNRLGLARWLVDERNPLTARVAVNRIWSLFFGRGLVATVEDFGSQGELPSHPELLDWLARDFIDSGWDVKRLCRMIVSSATYRQSSRPTDPAHYKIDPQNRLLARGPSHRLSAEQLRDQALAATGLLVQRLGGPSVKPYQPAGLWAESGTGKTYVQDHGPKLYRRSLYTFWRRTAPPPNMLAFDATSREVCIVHRERTTTPLQALVTLNDPQFVEAARVLATRLFEEFAAAPDPPAAAIRSAFRRFTARYPTDDELHVLRAAYDEQVEIFSAAPENAEALLSTGEAPPAPTEHAARQAALTTVVLAIMNFDEALRKP